MATIGAYVHVYQDTKFKFDDCRSERRGTLGIGELRVFLDDRDTLRLHQLLKEYVASRALFTEAAVVDDASVPE